MNNYSSFPPPPLWAHLLTCIEFIPQLNETISSAWPLETRLNNVHWPCSINRLFRKEMYTSSARSLLSSATYTKIPVKKRIVNFLELFIIIYLKYSVYYFTKHKQNTGLMGQSFIHYILSCRFMMNEASKDLAAVFVLLIQACSCAV